MRNVKRYLWETDPKAMLRLEEDMEELDSRLQEQFNTVSKTYLGLFNNLYASQFVVLDTMNNALSDCIQKIEKSVRSNSNKLTPQQFEPNRLEGGSFKELLKSNEEAILGEGFEKKDNQELPNYKFSNFNFTDPVELKENKKIVKGVPEFSVEYAGRVFVFANEINRNKFVAKPR